MTLLFARFLRSISVLAWVIGTLGAAFGTGPLSSDVRVISEIENGFKLTCSGTIIATNAVLTAGHCARAQTVKQIWFQDRDPFEIDDVTVLGNPDEPIVTDGLSLLFGFRDPSISANDSKILIFASHPFDPDSVAEIRTSPLQEGEEVVFVKEVFDGIYDGAIRRRKVKSQVSDVDPKTKVITLVSETSKIDPGDSGSSLYDEEGKLIGISSKGYREYFFGAHINLFSPLDRRSNNYRFIKSVIEHYGLKVISDDLD